MIHRTHVVMAIACVAVLLTVGVGWFAFGQSADTNTPAELTTGMESPLVRDINLVREVQNLAARVSALEATVGKLSDDLNELKTKSKTK